VTNMPDTEVTDEGAPAPSAMAWEVSDYLRALSWACWIAAAFIFFAVAGGAVTATDTWLDSAAGLFVIGFVLRHVPEDVREMIADDRLGDVSFYLRMSGWVSWVASAFVFFSLAGALIQQPTTAWVETAFGLFVFAFALRHAPPFD
jgi:uncharacterized membrane protein YGL010W